MGESSGRASRLQVDRALHRIRLRFRVMNTLDCVLGSNSYWTHWSLLSMLWRSTMCHIIHWSAHSQGISIEHSAISQKTLEAASTTAIIHAERPHGATRRRPTPFWLQCSYSPRGLGQSSFIPTTATPALCPKRATMSQHACSTTLSTSKEMDRRLSWVSELFSTKRMLKWE
ncbi:hypothetical protein BKA81DRAFT_11438 [Phyllosticta paracitricarpa]